MTPDMKRLCDAAEEAVDQAIIDAGFGRDHSVEAIVRAVLTELREVSPEAFSATGMGTNGMEVEWEGSEAVGRGAITGLVSFILAEPATT